MRSTCDLSPEAADHAGRILMMLLEGEPIEHLIDRKALENASDALIALGNDTEVILGRVEYHVQLVKTVRAFSIEDAIAKVTDTPDDFHVTVFEGDRADPVYER